MKRTRSITAIVLVSLTVYATLNLIRVRSDIADAIAISEELRNEINIVEANNRLLKQMIADSESDEAAERIARERLGLVKPGDIVFVDMS